MLLLALNASSSFSLAQTPLKNARQLVLVTTPDWNTIQGKLTFFERKKARSKKWRKISETAFPVVVGRTGLAWGVGLHDVSVYEQNQPEKREGDGKSPAGVFKLTSTFFRENAENLAFKLPALQLAESTECVDDVNSSKYNRIIDRLKVGNIDWESSEKMLAVGEQYAFGVFVEHNANPPQKGGGSCIFLHVWKDEKTGTAGCTAMTKDNLIKILQWIDAKKNPMLVQLPESDYERLREAWKLPKNN